ncbi:Uncharacterised protein [Mycobacterium tuberculosis]|uniref:Uncharacterized protein n=1 Tax=Mycobacterium tuberculosis TaxID=1773 RepID=A0A655AW05_MYCTX|nr:Uncharacterised protein [Mycobacterium tuberculosis]
MPLAPLPISGRPVSVWKGSFTILITSCCRVCRGEVLAGAVKPSRPNSTPPVPPMPALPRVAPVPPLPPLPPLLGC